MQVAALAGCQSIACLCVVSHAFYSIFAAILYGDMTTDPQLPSWKQTHLLLWVTPALFCPSLWTVCGAYWKPGLRVTALVSPFVHTTGGIHPAL
ncbi:hypothetical protein B0H19DRAFT_1120681 [Mycena capillaripes]|nr:hypothetical protein B0H19DRAFT_1120681 [Mycena capillaripes]